jgi:NAD(P)-dependent dehydrogenase (short-subunit alcohol dehydrogenase family)/acyl carrier protein
MPGISSCNVGSPAELIRSNATYLVTGGLESLGLAVAEWMVERGARSVVLMGRHGMSERASEPLERIRQAGAWATVATADVCLVDDVASVLEAIERSMPRLRGVVHAAGITDEDTLVRLSRDRLRSAMAPKVDGAWNLHSLTRDVSLDFFILFSSGVLLTGPPGQGANAAADAFLEALAHHRRAKGLPALSINWGDWMGLGMAERPDLRRPFRNRGIGCLTHAQAVEALAFLLAKRRAQVAVMRVDWRRYVDARPAMSGITSVESLLQARVDLPSHDNTPARGTFPARDRAMSAEPSQRKRVVESILVEHAAGALGLCASRLDAHQPLNRLGFDSLMAIELRNRLEVDLGVAVPVVRFLDGVSLGVIAGELLEQLEQPVFERPGVPTSRLSAVSNGAAGHKGEDTDRQARSIDPEEARELLTKIGELSGATVDALLDHLMETDGERHRRAAL